MARSMGRHCVRSYRHQDVMNLAGEALDSVTFWFINFPVQDANPTRMIPGYFCVHLVDRFCRGILLEVSVPEFHRRAFVHSPYTLDILSPSAPFSIRILIRSHRNEMEHCVFGSNLTCISVCLGTTVPVCYQCIL